jgi:hypothetical protein
MTGVEQFKSKSLAELAQLCGKIAGNPGADSKTADKAHELRLEWVRLQQPMRQPKEQQKLEAQLKDRMAEFLAKAMSHA